MNKLFYILIITVSIVFLQINSSKQLKEKNEQNPKELSMNLEYENSISNPEGSDLWETYQETYIDDKEDIIPNLEQEESDEEDFSELDQTMGGSY